MADAPRVLIDTDAGVDDAIAIFMLLAAHKKGLVKVIAITTTNGNTNLDNVNKNVLRILETVGLLDNIPVYSGSESPLVHPYLSLLEPDVPFHGHDGFGNTNLPHPDPRKYMQKKSAVIKILEEVQQIKGILHILALGPLTNLALVKKLQPDLLCRLASLHVMGGNYKGEGNITACGEFNFTCDPEAAQIVLSKDKGQEGHCPVHITTWETCLYAVNLPKAYRFALGEGDSPQARLISQAEAQILSRPTEQWISCDQLASAWFLDTVLGADIMKAEKRHQYSHLATSVEKHNVTVELQGRHTRGQMVLDRQRFIDYALPVTILTAVNVPYFKRFIQLAFGNEF